MIRLVPFAIAASVLGACSSPTAVSPHNQEGFFRTADGTRLHYVVDLPGTPADGPYPLVVLGHGSGATTIQDQGGFAVRLLDLGLAVLRFDKRGAGDSGGTYPRISESFPAEVWFPILADDVAGAVATGRTIPGVDSGRVGLFGESQSGWILPIVAVQDPSLAFVVLLSGPTVHVAVNIYFEEQAKDPSLSLDDLSQLLASFEPWPDFEPLPYLSQVEVPTLWIYGQEDRLVPVRESVARLEGIPDRPFTWHVIPGHDHALRPVHGGAAVDYWPLVDQWLDSFGLVER